MRILTGYFSLEGRQAHTKKIEVKKARFFLTKSVTYYLLLLLLLLPIDNELAIRAFMFGLHSTPEP